MKFIKKVFTFIPLIFSYFPNNVKSYDYSLQRSNTCIQCDKCGEISCDGFYFKCDDSNFNLCGSCQLIDNNTQLKMLIKKFVPEFDEFKILSLINNYEFIDQIPIVKYSPCPLPDSYKKLGRKDLALYFLSYFVNKVIENGIDKYDEIVKN